MEPLTIEIIYGAICQEFERQIKNGREEPDMVVYTRKDIYMECHNECKALWSSKSDQRSRDFILDNKALGFPVYVVGGHHKEFAIYEVPNNG